MHIPNHSLTKEFPELSDRIQQMQKTDGHFASLFDKYNAVDQQIHTIEAGRQAATDAELTELRKQRLHYKDELFGMLQKAA